METIIQQLDNFYSKQQYDEGYQFLLNELQKAIENNDDFIVLGILSELMGYYRVHAMFDLGNTMALRAIHIIQSRQLEQTVLAGTTYLNIATLYRIQGKYQEAGIYFEKCKNIYDQQLDPMDSRAISLDNNYSIHYQSIGKTKEALHYALKAYRNIQLLEDSYEEQAISATNIANMYFQGEDIKQGKTYVDRAIQLFKEHAPSDPHYSGALHSLAQYYTLQQDYTKAIPVYEEVLDMIEHTFGKNSDYDIAYKNYQYVKQLMNKQPTGMELSKAYYEQIGKQAFEKNHLDILSSLAFGLIGMGSECLGYDDELSRDHDFGPGFVVFVPKAMYQKHYHELQATYDSLPKEFQGIKRIETSQGQGRVGVVCLEDFFYQFIGPMPQTNKDWFSYPGQSLLILTSGQVFEDHLGMLTKMRESLKQYPQDVRLKKIVRALAKMAQAGQYNYPRCLQRKDNVAASLALHEFISQTLDCLCLLEGMYTPYYKWTYHALKQTNNQTLLSLVEQLTTSQEDKTTIIETICIQIVSRLQQVHLTNQQDPFLQVHLEDVMSHIEDQEIASMHVMEG